jgi:hypothetical protein
MAQAHLTTTDVAESSGVRERVRLHVAKPCIEDHIGLAYSCALSFVGKGAHSDVGLFRTEDTEEYSLALLGLWDAVESYNPDLGFKFSTHAYKCMQSRILDGRKFNGRLKRNIPLVEVDDLDCFIGDGPANFLHEQILEFIKDQSDLPIGTDKQNMDILRGHYIDGDSWAELGKKFGMTRAGARHCGQEAIKIIRNRFNIRDCDEATS